MARYTANVEVAEHGLIVPISLGIWSAPDEPDLWVQSLTAAGWPIRLCSIAVHVTPAEFLHYHRR